MNPVAHGITDVGRRREKNEDAFLADPELRLFAVADGMGGHAAGEIASALAIRSLRDVVGAGGWNAETAGVTDAVRRLTAALEEGNRQICDSIVAHAERRGMGTTVVALVALAREAVIAHIGDSRAYLLRRGALRRLTSDHSWVNEQVKLGVLSDEDAQRHPMRNIVTRALGSRPEVAIDTNVEPMEPGDVFLLCSDGLNTMLSDTETEATLREHARDPEVACRALVEAANARGGDDNVTVVVVAVPPEAPGR